MLNARFVPIDKWPGRVNPPHRRKRSTFRATYRQTLDLLESELEKLGAREVLIQAYFTRRDIGNDGWPKSTAKASDDGVVLSFESPKGPLSFPCDTYDTYDDNLRAIALALEALRAVDRYGVTRGNEQYQGWAQLPPASPNPKAEAAAELIARYSGFAAPSIFENPDLFRQAYRAACRKVHPDSPGGSHELFVDLARAKEALDKHHGL